MTDADIDIIRAIIRTEVEAAIAVMLAALEEARELAQAAQAALPADVSAFDRELARIVEQVWRDQGRKPVTTPAVAMHIGYSAGYTRTLLQSAERSGAVASLPAGRGSRHSGRWLPVERAA
jgi:hypothetical protein